MKKILYIIFIFSCLSIFSEEIKIVISDNSNDLTINISYDKEEIEKKIVETKNNFLNWTIKKLEELKEIESKGNYEGK